VGAIARHFQSTGNATATRQERPGPATPLQRFEAAVCRWRKRAGDRLLNPCDVAANGSALRDDLEKVKAVEASAFIRCPLVESGRCRLAFAKRIFKRPPFGDKESRHGFALWNRAEQIRSLPVSEKVVRGTQRNRMGKLFLMEHGDALPIGKSVLFRRS
jgi:hypothetical protein